MDNETTVAELRLLMARFVAERDWEQFHSPKNLSMALAIEVGELMEHFQWISMSESRLIADNPAAKQEVAAEMADILCYLLGLANCLDVDLSTAMREKMIRNRQKYPVEKYRGRF
jgi:NTP pyrophosphatase (non-canonical NTP hydrolase)